MNIKLISIAALFFLAIEGYSTEILDELGLVSDCGDLAGGGLFDIREARKGSSALSKICKKCDVIFTNPSSYSRHQSEKHDKHGTKIFYCTICRRYLSSKRVLNRHNDALHNQGGQHQCSKCMKSFRYKDNLKRHKTKVHVVVRSVGQHVCELCNKTFTRSSSLNRHKNTKGHQRLVRAQVRQQENPSSDDQGL